MALVVLVVDDHDGFRWFARKLLEGAGFVVAEAATGEGAVAVAATVRPDLVLLDVQLPDTDGFAVADNLTGLTCVPVIVLMSSREAADYGERLADGPAAGFLPKETFSVQTVRRFLADGGSG